jgi:hypothetical protein
MRVSTWTAATLVWILLASGACLTRLIAQTSAQSAEPAAADKAGKELHALRISANPTAIRVDGRIDDEGWMRAPVISDLTQEDPDNMMAPTESTTVRVAYDDRYVYVAVQMAMHDVAELRDGFGRRGSAPPSDRVLIAFDTAHDHQNAYVFEVNASGVQNDYLDVGDTGTNNDYEAVWEVVTLQTGQGWNAEFRIPFSQMRFPSQDTQTVWGFNIRRDVFARGEQDWWVARPRGAQGVVSRFGHLIFDDRLTPPRRLEFTPYVLGQLQTKSGAAATGAGNAGFDVRLGLGSSASLSATVNPDFGQVEADPSVLNLSVFETFFPEKRPFFLEDSQTFVLPYGLFPDFYSRRIGQRPNHFELSDHESLVAKPDNTTIVGAVKLTGKTSRWNYGALTAITSRERGTVDVTSDAVGGSTLIRRERKVIEPRSIYSVARVSRNLLGDTSNVGLIATNVTRELDADASLAGVDATLRRDRNRFNLNGHAVVTHAPIDGVVRNGFGGVLNSEYTTKYYNVNGHLDRFSPSFRNSDMGFFFARPDKNEAGGGVFLYQPDPKWFIRSSMLNVYGGRQWNDDHLPTNGWNGINGSVNFTNFWNVFIGLTRRPSQYDDVGSRGGPPILMSKASWVNISIDSDSRKQWGGGLRVFAFHNAFGGYSTQIEPNVRLQPSRQVVATVGVGLTSSLDDAQWIKNIDADGDATEDNVYGTLRRHEINITTRGTYSFTRDLTLEAYVQPFVAVGNYFDIRKLARPMSYEFTPVTLADDPDFNKKSVRGTIVLRWEYVRGSTLFMVWNLATSDEETRKGIYAPWRDLRGAFGAPATNTLAIKLSYWFAP